MNERIRELRNEAEKWVADNFSTDELDPYEWWEKEEQKFAELIVRECAQLILDKKMGDLGDNPGVKEWEEGYNEAVHDCYYHIKKHFGVEE